MRLHKGSSSNFSVKQKIQFNVFSVRNQVDSVISVMKDNIGKVVARGDQLDTLQDRSEALSNNTEVCRVYALDGEVSGLEVGGQRPKKGYVTYACLSWWSDCFRNSKEPPDGQLVQCGGKIQRFVPLICVLLSSFEREGTQHKRHLCTSIFNDDHKYLCMGVQANLKISLGESTIIYCPALKPTPLWKPLMILVCMIVIQLS